MDEAVRLIKAKHKLWQQDENAIISDDGKYIWRVIVFRADMVIAYEPVDKDFTLVQLPTSTIYVSINFATFDRAMTMNGQSVFLLNAAKSN